MNLDLQTVFFLLFVVCAVVAAALALTWYTSSAAFKGINYWLAGMFMQAIASLLISLQLVLPGFLSIVLANTLAIAGLMSIYTGLELFVNRKSSQFFNLLLLTLFFLSFIFFTYMQPNLTVRVVAAMVTIALISAQALHLLIVRSDPETRGATSGVKYVFAGIAALSLARLIYFLVLPAQGDNFLAGGLVESVFFTGYLALYVFLGICLILAVNYRLQQVAAKGAEDLEEAQSIAQLGRWEIDIESGDLIWSDQIYRLFEVERGEFKSTYEAFLSFVHPDDRRLLDQVYRESVESKKPYKLEHRLLMADGRIKWVSERGHTSFDLDGKARKSVGTVQDITDRKEAEQLLQSRLNLVEYSDRHSLEEVLQQTLDEVCAVVSSSIGFYHFVSRDQKELILKAWSTDTLKHFCQMGSLSGKSYSIDVAGIWAESVNTGEVAVHNDYKSLPNRKGLPDGHAEVIRELVVPIIRGGRVVSILGVGNKMQDYNDRDVQIVSHYADVAWEIAERKIAEAELEKARDLAEEANRAKSKFLANMSHEIRTPLNAIIGMNTLLDQSGLEGEAGEYASMAREASEHLSTIIGDVLDISRIEANQLEIVPTRFNLLEEVRKTVAVLNVQAESKGLDILLKHDQSLPAEVVLDLSRVKQVLINLINNAIKFTETGAVELMIRPLNGDADSDSDSEANIPGAGEPEYARAGEGETEGNGQPGLEGLDKTGPGRRDMILFSVSDTGPGIPEEERDYVFESFSQLEKGKYQGSSGTGLGLAICKSIVELMGGKIWVESAAGDGSTFYFTLPLSISSEEKSGDTLLRVQINDGGREDSSLSLLLVEDKAMNRKLATVFLEQLGHRVDIAVNGREAVAAVEKTRYDAVLMDINMPEMDGVEATKEIRAREKETGKRRVPIIAMTAYAIIEEQKAFIAAGMDDHISKPIKKEVISEALSKLSGSK